LLKKPKNQARTKLKKSDSSKPSHSFKKKENPPEKYFGKIFEYFSLDLIFVEEFQSKEKKIF